MSFWRKKDSSEVTSNKSPSFLSPFNFKRRLGRKKLSSSFNVSHSAEEEISFKKHASHKTDHHSSDSIYSAVDSLEDRSIHIPHSTATKSVNGYDGVQTNQLNKDADLDCGTTKIKEPLYATINKSNRQKAIDEKQHLENIEIQELKDANKILKERLKELSEDNMLLKKKMQDFLKEEKLKEDTLHSKLQLRITELEAETRKDVKSLSDQIHILMKEKQTLNDQIDILQTEKRDLHTKCESLCNKIRTMISPEMHNKFLAEHEKQMNGLKSSYKNEINKLQELNTVLESSKISLEHQVQELKRKMATLEAAISSLELSNQELVDKNKSCQLQAEESRQMEQDIQALLMSLLKMTENIAQERNILLNKTSFQDHQQKELQTTVVDYSLNIGRLQEHFLNINKDSQQEIMKFRSNIQHQEDISQHMHKKQIDLLREKIFAQQDIISGLEKDKKKLESQLEITWQAACGTNSKLLDEIKSVLNSQEMK